MTRRVDLTQGSVVKHVLRMTPPMAMAFFAMLAFNLVDTWFVSKLGTEALAAMGFTFPVVMISHAIAMGLGMGVSATVSRAIGAQDNERVQLLSTYSLLLTFVIMLVLSALVFIFRYELLGLLGAEGLALELSSKYIAWWLLFTPIGLIPMVGNSAIRSTGDTLRPGIIMSVAALINIVLDPIFIFGWGPVPAMGVTGAALATGVSRLITFVWAIWVMHYRCQLLNLHWAGIRKIIQSWGSVLQTALPSMATSMLAPLSGGVITRMIASHGEAAVAATAAGQRIEYLTYLVPMAMGATLVPIIGQNWGAGRIDRVREVWRKTNWFGLGYGVISLILAIPLARPVAELFSNDPYIIELISNYLVIILCGAIFIHSEVHTGFAFNAIQRPLTASFLRLCRYVFLLIPLTWLGGRLFGLYGIYIGMAASFAIAGAVSISWFAVFIKKQEVAYNRGSA
ncbi:MAG: MATE family efflux transporter [Puniceicoccaceae bacterium]